MRVTTMPVVWSVPEMLGYGTHAGKNQSGYARKRDDRGRWGVLDTPDPARFFSTDWDRGTSSYIGPHLQMGVSHSGGICKVMAGEKLEGLVDSTLAHDGPPEVRPTMQRFVPNVG